MPHFLSYSKKTGDVTGYVQMTAPDATLVPRDADEAYLEITSAENIKALAKFRPRESRLKARVDGGVLISLQVEPAFVGLIVLTCDRSDMDADGVAELPADGNSIARITARLVGADTKPIPADGLQVDFRVTRGSLSYRSQPSRAGQAQTDLRSTTETVRAVVTAAAKGYAQGRLSLEFIPVEEHRALQAGVANKVR